MKRPVLVVLLALVVFLGLPSIALADGKLDTDSVTTELKSVGKMLLAAIFLIFLVVGGYTIVQGLLDARKNGGWSHVVIGIAVVFVSGLAIWILTTLSGQSPETISNSVKVDK